MAEAEAMQAAMVACVERGFENVQIETDSKVMVDMLTRVISTDVAMKGVIWDIHHLKLQLCSVQFLFTPRSCNEAAHVVASHVTRVGGCHVWDCLESKWLFNVLASDVNISIRI